MKTKNIIIIAIMAIFSTLNLSAQETNGYNNEPFLKEGRVWNCYRGYTKGYIDEIGRQKDALIQDYYFYTLNGDTLINGQEYMKLFKTSKVEYEDEELHYFAAVREDGDRVFIIYDAENEETLLYDFCAKEDGEEFVCGKHTFYVEFQEDRWYNDTNYHALFLTSELIEDKEVSEWYNPDTGERGPAGPCDFVLISGYGITSKYDGFFASFNDPFNIEEWFNQYKPHNADDYIYYSNGYLKDCYDADLLVYDSPLVTLFFEMVPTWVEKTSFEREEWSLKGEANAIYDLTGRKFQSSNYSWHLYLEWQEGAGEVKNTSLQPLRGRGDNGMVETEEFLHL